MKIYTRLESIVKFFEFDLYQSSNRMFKLKVVREPNGGIRLVRSDTSSSETTSSSSDSESDSSSLRSRSKSPGEKKVAPRRSRSRSRSPVEKKDVVRERSKSRSKSRSTSPERESKAQKYKRWKHYNEDHHRILQNYFKQDISVQIYILSALVETAMKKVYLHPVRFECVWKRLPYSRREFDDAITEQEFHAEPPCFGWHDLAFGPHITVLHMSTNSTGNDDTRGGGCGDMNIPTEEFKWTMKNPTGITFQNVVEAAYRMKGSKYDWWYELYSGITAEKPKPDQAPNELYLSMDFDYGS